MAPDSPQPRRRQSRRRLLIGLGLLAAGLLVLILWPSPLDPAAYQPPPGPEMAGVYAPNDLLARAERLAAGQVRGPEDVAVTPLGDIYVGTEDGRIVWISPDGNRLQTVADTGGRPLGLAFDAAGYLWVADAKAGLLRLTLGGGVSGGVSGDVADLVPTGATAEEETAGEAADEEIDRTLLPNFDPAAEAQIEILSRGADGVPFGFTDDLDVASDGRVYFSDASDRFGVGEYLYDLLEARPHGRLLRYDPASGETEVLADDLYFANGIALSQDEDFVLVNETYRYRISRYWIRGPKAGTLEIFIDNLPGFPDGVSANRRGTFWAALFTVRNPKMDRLHPQPGLKSFLAKLPGFLWPKPAPYGLVLAIDESGRVVRTLQDPGGKVVSGITSAEEMNGQLYLGTLKHDYFARVALSP